MMSTDDRHIPIQPIKISPVWLGVSALLALVGIVTFIVGLLHGDRLRIWQAYLFNYFYWTSLSFGSAVFLAALNITNATWGRPLKRLAEGLAAFLPVSFVLFWVIYLGRAELFEWVSQPLPEKRAWLNVPFLFVRDGAAHLILTTLSLAMIVSSLRADRDQTRPEGTPKGNASASWRTQKILSPLVGVAYAFVLSLLAIDLLMSLDQHWYSTMFPVYVFTGGFYTAIASIYFLALLAGRHSVLGAFFRPRQYHDLGKLVMAFSLFTGYLYYTQFLVMWYGNLPEETRHLIIRTRFEPWAFLSWVVLLMILLIPFFALLSRRIKLIRVPMLFLTLMILIGMWFERFLLVAPSIWRFNFIPLGLTEISIGLGFLGLTAFCFLTFIQRVPPLPVGDPLFQRFLINDQAKLEP
jgi:hypothetical protein